MYNFDPLAVDRVLKEMRFLATNGQSIVGRIDPTDVNTDIALHSGHKETIAKGGGDKLPVAGVGKGSAPSCNTEGATEPENGRRNTNK